MPGSKKNSILIIVSVVSLGAAGIILYRGFFRSAPAPKLEQAPALGQAANPTATVPSTSTAAVGSPAAVGSSGAVGSGQILPYGNRLDFSPVKKFNSTGQLFNYPQLTPDQLGPDLGEIFKPAPPKTSP